MADLIDALDGDPATWGSYERIRLGAAIELDRVTENGRRAASEAYPEGGLVARLADELGTDVETLLAWVEVAAP